MDEQVQQALAQGGVIDITTRGRHTGQPRRIEIRFHHIEGQVYITGRPPRRRNWYANLLAHPEFSFHLNECIKHTCQPGPRPFWIGPTPCDHRGHSSETRYLSRCGGVG